MADKAIGELVAATQVTSTDLFVLEQNSTAKKLTGQILENWLVSFADGHGGIQTIEKTGTNVLVDTYTITLADQTTMTFDVTNGRSITGITWQSSGTPGDGQVHTGTIAYNDGTTGSIVITDGVKGDTGAAEYCHIRWSSVEPTRDSDVYDTPDDWMGVYTGLEASTANLHYTDYQWCCVKGDTGATGADCTVVDQIVEYQASTSGTVVPTGAWSTTVPAVSNGQFLWTRITIEFSGGSEMVAYSVGYYGRDGSGAGDMQKADYDDSNAVFNAGGIPTYVGNSITSALATLISGLSTRSGVSSVDQLIIYDPQSGANYKQSRQAFLADVVAYEPIRIDIPSFNSLPQTVNNAAITEDMVVLGSWFSKVSSQTKDWTVTTSNGSLTVSGESGAISGWTALTLILGKANV